MKNEVTEKLELFLQNLRCEDMGRETLVHLDSCRMESVSFRKNEQILYTLYNFWHKKSIFQFYHLFC